MEREGMAERERERERERETQITFSIQNVSGNIRFRI